jgi:hypothetical protein
MWIKRVEHPEDGAFDQSFKINLSRVVITSQEDRFTESVYDPGFRRAGFLGVNASAWR